MDVEQDAARRHGDRDPAGGAREERAHASAAPSRQDQRERGVERRRGGGVPAGERRAEGLGDRVERRPRAIDQVLDAVRDELVAGEHEHEEERHGEIRAPAQLVEEDRDRDQRDDRPVAEIGDPGDHAGRELRGVVVAPLRGARVDVRQGGIAADQVGQGADHEAADDDHGDGGGERETGRHGRVGARAPPGAQRARLDGRARRPRRQRPSRPARERGGRTPGRSGGRRRERSGGGRGSASVGGEGWSIAARGFSRRPIGETSGMNLLRSVAHAPVRETVPRTLPGYDSPRPKDDTPSLLVAPRGSEAEQLGRRFARPLADPRVHPDHARRLPAAGRRDDRARLPAGGRAPAGARDRSQRRGRQRRGSRPTARRR